MNFESNYNFIQLLNYVNHLFCIIFGTSSSKRQVFYTIIKESLQFFESIDDVTRFVEFLNRFFVLLFIEPIQLVKAHAPQRRYRQDLYVITVQYMLKSEFNKSIWNKIHQNVRPSKRFKSVVFSELIVAANVQATAIFNNHLKRFSGIKLQKAGFPVSASERCTDKGLILVKLAQSIARKSGDIETQVLSVSSEGDSTSSESYKNSSERLIQCTIERVIACACGIHKPLSATNFSAAQTERETIAECNAVIQNSGSNQDLMNDDVPSSSTSSVVKDTNILGSMIADIDDIQSKSSYYALEGTMISKVQIEQLRSLCVKVWTFKKCITDTIASNTTFREYNSLQSISTALKLLNCDFLIQQLRKLEADFPLFKISRAFNRMLTCQIYACQSTLITLQQSVSELQSAMLVFSEYYCGKKAQRLPKINQAMIEFFESYETFDKKAASPIQACFRQVHSILLDCIQLTLDFLIPTMNGSSVVDFTEKQFEKYYSLAILLDINDITPVLQMFAACAILYRHAAKEISKHGNAKLALNRLGDTLTLYFSRHDAGISPIQLPKPNSHQ